MVQHLWLINQYEPFHGEIKYLEIPLDVSILQFFGRIYHGITVGWINGEQYWQCTKISTNENKKLFFKKKFKAFDNRDVFMWILFSPTKYIYDRKCLRFCHYEYWPSTAVIGGSPPRGGVHRRGLHTVTIKTPYVTTEVRLKPRHGKAAWCSGGSCRCRGLW